MPPRRCVRPSKRRARRASRRSSCASNPATPRISWPCRSPQADGSAPPAHLSHAGFSLRNQRGRPMWTAPLDTRCTLGSGRLAGVDSPQGRGGLLLARISGAITDQDHGLALFGGLCPRDGAFVGLGVLDNVVACGKGRRRQADGERTGEGKFSFHESLLKNRCASLIRGPRTINGQCVHLLFICV